MAKTMREPKDVTAKEAAVMATTRLRHAGLRPTRQRVELAGLLFRDQDRHVTAESLHDEVTQAGLRVSPFGKGKALTYLKASPKPSPYESFA